MNRFDRSNLRADIEERDRLYEEMTDLSIRAMGLDRVFGTAKNIDQINNVTDSLGNLHNFREGLESPTSEDNLDLGDIEFTKAILEEKAQEFKNMAKACLASYDASSRPVVLEHLKEMKKLYDVSYARANEILNKKAQALQAGKKHRASAARVSSEVTRKDFEKLASVLNGSTGEHVDNLTIEVNDGTSSTPGQHIRISGDPDVQTALKNAIQAAGLTIEEKVRGSTPIVVVRLTEPFDSAVSIKIMKNFQREMRQIQIGRAMPDLSAKPASVKMEASYEEGRIAWEHGVYQQELGNIETAEDLMLMAAFNGYEKAYTSLAIIALSYGNASLSKAFIDMGIGVEDPNAYEMLGVYNRAIRSETIVEQPSSIGDELYEQANLLQRRGDYAEASRLYNQAAFMGNKKAYASIGMHLLTGIPGTVPINKSLAATYFSMGVAAGHPRAMLNLAKMYERGDGVIQSDEMALGLYKKAHAYDRSDVYFADKIHLLERRISEKLRFEQARVRAPERAALNAKSKHSFTPSDYDYNAEYRNYLQRIIAGFNMHSEFTTEINAGTNSTPGEHLRISAQPEAYYELTALKSALDETGISYEEKARGVGGVEKMLVIRDVPPMTPGFEAKFKQLYVAALKKIDAEAKATRVPQARNSQQQEHTQAARQIIRDIGASNKRMEGLARELKSRKTLHRDSESIAARDEIEYFLEETLNEFDVEKNNIIQLEQRLKAELAISDLPASEQQEILLLTRMKIQVNEEASLNLHDVIENIIFDTESRYDTPPLSSAVRAERLQQPRISEPETEASAAEKKELLAEIKRIKHDIHNMVENLTNEIPQAMFSKDLKTQKRNTLLSLSRTLYVSEKSSLAELHECADKFRGELAKCQTDAVLRQGTFRKNCRTLIDKLANDVESEQHVFRRPK